ncbi:MAG: hypothetical protein RIS44_1761 [Pseudomonadota bacterium]
MTAPSSTPRLAPPDTDRWVLASPDIQRAQVWHSRITVVLPLLLALAGPFYWPTDINWPLAIASFMLMGALVGCLGISVGFHRHFAHRAFRAQPWVRAMMATVGQMAGQGPVTYWTALHRRHHSFADWPGDPHSPSLRAVPSQRPQTTSTWRAFWHSHFLWATNHAVPMPTRYVPDLLADPLVRRVNAAYVYCMLLGLLLPTVLGWMWTGSSAGAIVGFYFGGVLRMVLMTQFIWAINSVCHTFGSRPHDTGDFSTNNHWLAGLTFGECWHNNHHHAPTHARFGHGWSQPDPGWWTIRFLQRCGLVWDVLGEQLKAENRERVR